MRKWINAINEYQQIPPLDWNGVPPRPDHAVFQGRISAACGTLDLYAAEVESNEHGEVLGVWACFKEEAIAFVAVALGQHSVLHQAIVHPDHQRQGILSEIVNFLVHTKNTPLISDTRLTAAGEALVASLNNKMKASIFYIPTGEKFPLKSAGNATTSDGHKVIDPADDFLHPEMFDPSTQQGQRFFYLWESPQSFTNIVEGVTYNYGFSKPHHTRATSQPSRYFYEDDAP